MTRINTNVSSIVAQKNLARSNADLQQALTRLSTGLRINVGKDDPAGLIASEVLRSDIISVERAITNSERANQLIATADSALGQVSSLLNDIRGLVSEAANTGALSDAQIAADQLQVDSSLEAIDRIAQTTAFQGRRLLDGSLDFITTSAGTADIGASATIGSTNDAAAFVTVDGDGGSAFTASGIVFTAKISGSAYNGFDILLKSAVAAGSETVSINLVTKTVSFSIDSGSTTAATLVTVLANNALASAVFSASAIEGGGAAVVGSDTAGVTASTASGADSNKFIISATSGNEGIALNDVKVVIVTTGTAGSESASYTTGATNVLTITVDGTNSTANVIAAAINATADFEFSASTTGLGFGIFDGATLTYDAATTGGALGSGNISDLQIDQANFGTSTQIDATITIDTQAQQGALTYSGGTLSGDLILEIGGLSGFEVFNFGTSTTVSQIRDALNLVSDATGISATVNTGTADGGGDELVLTSSEYGSDAFVSARALSGTLATFADVSGTPTASTRDNGLDIELRINGVKATGDGLRATLNTSTLDLNFSVNSVLTAGDTISFSITGGGAIFQLGPDVVSNQQARLGIQGVSTATLGGVSGTLFELRTGGAKDLRTDVKGAAKVIEEVITSVTELRGRLGAFQRTTLETNIFTLQDTLENLTDAESSIRDADFAAESANLTRAQILVQSGTSVLGIANSNPQNVLALLR
ncbi:MAG: flagellin [Planctomycetes bacterium]|nr:flagellin [Planctomycetota bacterium]